MSRQKLAQFTARASLIGSFRARFFCLVHGVTSGGCIRLVSTTVPGTPIGSATSRTCSSQMSRQNSSSSQLELR